jgi:hypothetical protein
MNRNRIIFYLVFLLFHVGAFIFTIRIQDFTFITQVYQYIGLFKYATFFGILLVVTDIVWTWRVIREIKDERDALVNELTNLKAKLFDLQEVAKEKDAAAAKDTPKVN